MKGAIGVVILLAAALAPSSLAQSGQPPVASFKVSALGFLVSTDSSTSSQGSNGQIVTRSWNWGDGAASAGRFGTHQYRAEGDYSIRLTVTDGKNASSTAVQPVSLSTFDVEVNELDIRVDASRVAGAQRATLAWDFGDGNEERGANATHEYARDGDYEVKLTLTTSELTTQVTRLVTAEAAKMALQTPVQQPTPEITSVPSVGFILLLAGVLTVARLRRAR